MSTTQHQDGYAWTWEPAAAALLTTAVLALMSIQAARSLTLLAAGHGWQWPDSEQLVTSTGGILGGDLSAGLSIADPVGGAVGAWILAAILFTASLIAVLVLAVRWATGHRYRGMATTSQATRLLGISRLRANRRVIRPDLYRKEPR